MAAGEGQVIVCDTVGKWNEQLEESKDDKKLLLDGSKFTAKIYTKPVPIKKLPHILFLEVDVDELKEWAVEAMPTFIFIKEKKKVDKVELQLAVAKHDPGPGPSTATASA